MKLVLVMLTIVISKVTERQVEAAPPKVECFAQPNLKGNKVTITGDMPDATNNQRPKGFRSCQISGTVLFYTGKNYVGHVNAISGEKKEYNPDDQFIIQSILVLQDGEGAYFFEEKNFQKGIYKHFDKKVDPIKPAGTKLGSAALIGDKHWTFYINCGGNWKCPTCLQKTNSNSSFISAIYDVDKAVSVTPGICKPGYKYVGQSIILSCGCVLKNVPANETICYKSGNCNCRRGYGGKKCDRCESGFYDLNGVCEDCGCHYTKIKDLSDKCHSNGTCKCRQDLYSGDKCEKCQQGLEPVGSYLCLDKQQYNIYVKLQGYCNNAGATKGAVAGALDSLRKGIVVSFWHLANQIRNGNKLPQTGACDGIRYLADAYHQKG